MSGEEQQNVLLLVSGELANFCFNKLLKCTDKTCIHRPTVNKAELEGRHRIPGQKVFGNCIYAAARRIATVLRVLREGDHIGGFVSAKLKVRSVSEWNDDCIKRQTKRTFPSLLRYLPVVDPHSESQCNIYGEQFEDLIGLVYPQSNCLVFLSKKEWANRHRFLCTFPLPLVHVFEQSADQVC